MLRKKTTETNMCLRLASSSTTQIFCHRYATNYQYILFVKFCLLKFKTQRTVRNSENSFLIIEKKPHDEIRNKRMITYNTNKTITIKATKEQRSVSLLESCGTLLSAES